MKDGEDIELQKLIYQYINEKQEWNDDDPFYIVDLNKLIDQYNAWNENLPDIKPYFAVKSNPDIKIISLLAQLGCNFDCASKSEIGTVLNIVDDPGRIIFANPCKTPSHITYARNNNVNLMTFDCIEELVKIQKLHPTANLLLRICVDDSNSKCKFNSKFGCKLDDIEDVFKKIIDLKLNLVGFSFHVGSGCQDPKSFYTAIRDCKFAYIIASKYGLNISIIDIGGGFPGSDKNITFKDICTSIVKGQNDFFKQKIISGTVSFIAEPGRFFTESTHTLVVSVIAKKQEDNHIKYYLNDGVYGSFNCMYYDHQLPQLIPFKPITNAEKRNKSTFFGPTCDSMDVMYKDISFPELDIGDWLYIKNYGSYTCAPSSSFNGFMVNDFKYIYPPNYHAYSISSLSSSISSFSF